MNPKVDTVGRTVTRAFICLAENIEFGDGLLELVNFHSRNGQLRLASDFNSDHLQRLLGDLNDKTLHSHDAPILLWYLVIIRSQKNFLGRLTNEQEDPSGPTRSTQDFLFGKGNAARGIKYESGARVHFCKATHEFGSLKEQLVTVV
ncbi:unnamed protein product [Hymenolepis diminuta]|uniref:Uncharacterized protein n=1 Tax=Hymenolepis diminuta TaxID=6216 RepID=A0A0R3SQR2_HYMDI|nr:unnamed protein product [Hymenolepis diminuta]